VKIKYLIIFSITLLNIAGLSAETRGNLERPLLIGPQYPLVYMSTTFEPDTAFLLKEGEIFFQTSYTLLNTWGYSANAVKTSTGVSFNPTGSNGYSVYFDCELDRRFLKLQYGYSDNLELLLVYREIRSIPGSLDATVEDFHNFINIGNMGRDLTEKNQFEIYIYDNESGRVVLSLNQTSAEFVQESITLGVKFLLKKTANEAISLSFSSNFGDNYIERGVNDSTNDSEESDHSNFNDFNTTLRYTSIFTDWTLHGGFSISFVNKSLLPKSPEELYYLFLGVNYHVSEYFDLLLQDLEYSSPFPTDNISSINADVREISTGARLYLGKQFSMDLGFVENQSQGPQNIDIAFFANIMFYF